ncbi:MAG TPA: glycosyltransferase 87 family protein [Solirubrobacteraceae bacterium]|jgi:hypothetical protein
MGAVATALPCTPSAVAVAARRAAFVAALLVAALLPMPRDEFFDFPALAHAWTLAPFGLLIALAIFSRRSPWRPQLDVIAVLALFIPLAYAGVNRPWSAFLLAPPLLYVGVRLPASARLSAPPAPGLRPVLPRTWLLAGIAVLCAIHVTWAFAGAVPTDVGIDSVQGALRLFHGHALYGASLGGGGDTYGPTNYLAYVPFATLVSSANSAARLATVFFSLLTALLLFLVGRRMRDSTVGVTLAFCWLALPLSLYEDALGWNDSLVAATLVGTILVADHSKSRGAMAALAAWTKFAPLALVPLLALRLRAGWRRELSTFAAGFAIASSAVFVFALAQNTPGTFLSQTLGFQAGRAPVDSIWASFEHYGTQISWLNASAGVLHGLVLAVTIALALLLPRARLREDAAARAAASAGVLALVTLSLSYFAFSYLLWTAPLVLIAAIVGTTPAEDVPPAATSVAVGDRREGDRAQPRDRSTGAVDEPVRIRS